MLTTEELIRRIDGQHSEVMNSQKTVTEKVDNLSQKSEEHAARLMDVEQKFGRLAHFSRGGGGGPVSLGAEVVASDEYKAFLQAGARGTHRIKVSNAITTGATSAGPMIVPDHQPEVVTLPRRRLTVRSLLAPGRTDSGLVRYTRQTGFTNNARPVSEGTAKPESAMTFELKEVAVRTIAHWIPVSRQAMDDARQLESLIDSEMRYGLALVEEEQMLFGSGSEEDLEGIVPRASDYNPPFTVENETWLDTLLLAIAQAQQALLPATGIVVNDMDWKRMQALKDSQGRYLASGPFGLQPAVAWTLPVVDTPAMPQGEFLVGAFQMGAQIFDRLDPEVLISSEDRDNFIKNMLTVRAEQRLALAVKRPSAFVNGQFNASGSSGS